MGKLLTLQDLAERLGMKYDTVAGSYKKWAEEGRFQVVRLGHPRFREEEVEKLIQSFESEDQS